MFKRKQIDYQERKQKYIRFLEDKGYVKSILALDELRAFLGDGVNTTIAVMFDKKQANILYIDKEVVSVYIHEDKKEYNVEREMFDALHDADTLYYKTDKVNKW